MKKKIEIIAPACAVLGAIEANENLNVDGIKFIPGNEYGLSYGHVNPEFPTPRGPTKTANKNWEI